MDLDVPLPRKWRLQNRDVLHLPAGIPVDSSVTSLDVIHAFWVPRLAGKIDAVPGHANLLRIQADVPGRYQGLCNEFCGIGHSGMRFDVIVHPAAEFSPRSPNPIATGNQRNEYLNRKLTESRHGDGLHRQLARSGPPALACSVSRRSTIPSSAYASWRRHSCSSQLAACSACWLACNSPRPKRHSWIPETYNQVFTMHGSMLLFLFAIPMIEGIAVYLTPEDAWHPGFRLPAADRLWLLVLPVRRHHPHRSLVAGVAPNGGWFMYTPLSSNVYTPGINADVWLLGVTFVEISALTLAVEIVVSVLKMRAPGMSLDRMPIFGWYMLVTALMMVVAFPPLILGSILLETERAFGLPFFDPTRGGDALLWQHLFWLFGHPDVYIIFLPMAGVLSDDHPGFRQHAPRRIPGDRRRNHRPCLRELRHLGPPHVHRGHPHLALAFFSAGRRSSRCRRRVQLFAWLATLAHGRPRWRRADALYLRLLFDLRDGRPDRRDARHRAVRLAGA